MMAKKACADGPNVLYTIYILVLYVAAVAVDGRVYTSSGNLIRVWHFRQIGGNLKVLPGPSYTPLPHHPSNHHGGTPIVNPVSPATADTHPVLQGGSSSDTYGLRPTRPPVYIYIWGTFTLHAHTHNKYIYIYRLWVTVLFSILSTQLNTNATRDESTSMIGGGYPRKLVVYGYFS